MDRNELLEALYVQTRAMRHADDLVRRTGQPAYRQRYLRACRAVDRIIFAIRRPDLQDLDSSREIAETMLPPTLDDRAETR